MKRISLILAFVLAFFIPLSAQNVPGTEIKDREIEWADFVGKPDYSSRFDAVTNWLIIYSFPRPKSKDAAVRVKATVRLLLRSDSWVKPGKQTARLLNHERGHFKIGAICARQIEETINSRTFDAQDYVNEIKAVHREILNKCRQIEKLYDRETEHYRNEIQQRFWDKKLNEVLNL